VRRIDIASLGSIYVASTDNSLVGSRDKPLAVNVPLHRTLSEMLGQEAQLGPAAGEADDRRNRRYVFAFMHDIELPLDPTTRVQTFVNCSELTPQTPIGDQSYATGVSFFGSEHSRHGAAANSGGASLCVDLSQPLGRMGQPRGPRTDRLTVQLLPRCESNEAHVSNIRPRRVEVVVL
jgi:hypothetical protein